MKLSHFLKLNLYIKFKNELLGIFKMSSKGMCYKKLKKLFNNKNYANTNGILSDDDVPNSLNFIPLKEVIGRGGDCFGGLMFIDPSHSNIKQLSLSKEGPKWRVISEGLNIFGICENPDCKAYKEEVIFRALKGNGSLPSNGMIFNMLENVENIICPMCNEIIDPETCGFFKCEYQFIGKK